MFLYTLCCRLHDPGLDQDQDGFLEKEWKEKAEPIKCKTNILKELLDSW